MQIHRISILFLLIVVPTLAMSQNKREVRREMKKERISEAIRLQEEGIIFHKKSFVFGAKLTNDGYGAFLELGRAKSIEKGLAYQLEITERKHHKEQKMGSAIPYGTSLIYGKQNFFYPVKIGVQQQVLFGNKSNKNGVAVLGNFGGGFTAGLLRPYYAQVLDGQGGLEYIKYDDTNKDNFLDYAILMGGPSLSKGWNEVAVVPGAYGKAAVRFDYGRFNEIVTGIELGITAEVYSQKIPQMALSKEKQFFFGAYCAVLFGKRS